MGRLEYKFRFQAWAALNEMFPGIDWAFDNEASIGAGYNIFRDKTNYYNYVCDLGNRYELNLKEGNRTINFWYWDAGGTTPNEEGATSKEEDTNNGIESNCSDVVISSQDAFYIRASLAKVASDFITLAISESNYGTCVDNAINCLSIIKRIKEKESNGNDHK